MKRNIFYAFCIFLLFLAFPAVAGVPSTMQFQGYLTDAEGEPLSGVHTITFTLHDAETDGNPVWTDTQSLALENGAFTAILGENNPLDANIFYGAPLWLGVTVDSGDELSPRSSISSVPYAVKAAEAEDVTGDIHPNSLSIDGNMIIDDSGHWVGDIAGLQGLKGDKGDKGDTGEQGKPGESVVSWSADPADCPTGGAGFQIGEAEAQFVCNGAAGQQGLKGDKGDTGEQGLKGDKGDTGQQGLKGDKGDTGLAGVDGINCWDLNENGMCDLVAEDTNSDAICSVNDCFSAAYSDLSADGRLDFNENTDIVTKEQLQNSVPFLSGTNTFTGSNSFSNSATFSGTVSVSGAASSLNVASTATATFNNTPYFARSTGTAPFSVISTTMVSNLNADMVDGMHASAFAAHDEILATRDQLAKLRAAIEYPNDVFPAGDYLWQKTPTGSTMNWANAVTHCEDLVLAGYDDWRLPSISELRSLIRGCDATQTGGSCGVTDDCLASECLNAVACDGCGPGGGPDGGSYWPSPIEGTSSFYWSSSSREGYIDEAWVESFNSGRLTNSSKSAGYLVRCVR